MHNFLTATREKIARSTAVLFLNIYSMSLKLLSLRRTKRRPMRDHPTILLTGTFASPNWVSAHIYPLTLSNCFSRVSVVSSESAYESESINWVVPRRVLVLIFGNTGARLITFCLIAARERPDFVAGFHFLFNGLAASFLAQLFGCRSICFCVGGRAEVEGGGVLSENRLFGKIGPYNYRIEKRLLTAANFSDSIIFMGSTAKTYYVERGYRGRVIVNPGGIKIPHHKQVRFASRDIDALFVGRLAKIKDLPLFLQMVAVARISKPDLRAVIVGDGEERQKLECQTKSLTLGDNVSFVGYQENVESWLSRSKALVLTSMTEGLSLAVLEAISCGVPVIAPRVGDLGDAVIQHETGFLVDSRNPEDFSEALLETISDQSIWEHRSMSAQKLSTKFGLDESIRKWSVLVSGFRTYP